MIIAAIYARKSTTDERTGYGLQPEEVRAMKKKRRVVTKSNAQALKNAYARGWHKGLNFGLRQVSKTVARTIATCHSHPVK